MLLALLATAGNGGAAALPNTDIASIVGLLNYGVLGVLTVGFIRGWVVSPKERDRLIEDNKQLKQEAADKDKEIARLNTVLQEQLQAMVQTTDKQIDLWSRQMRDGPRGSA